jgi:ABC-type multidrug transport system ATPase subunit/pSer/pThr/pTyr-binding forkhead associated (FHA) protein
LKYRLVHLSGSLAGRVREVDAARLVLGRDPASAEVVFGAEDRSVSRRHACIEEDDGVLMLRDLGSSTGTFLDGHDIEEAELRDGDVFELGPGGPRVRLDFGHDGTIVMPAPVALPPTAPAPARAPAPPPGPDSRLRLTFVSGTRNGSELELAGSVFRIGRARGSTVWTPEDPMVSAQHAKIVRLDEGYVLMDLESTNGTLLNGHAVQRSLLHDGDVIRLGHGGPELQVRILESERRERGGPATVAIPNFAELAARPAQAVALREIALDRERLSIGRAEVADLRLDSPIVSRSHAILLRQQGTLVIEDLGSTNGTYVGGKRVERATLQAGDRVTVGPFVLELAAESLRVRDTRTRARVDARGLTALADGKPILDGVSLSLPPGSFTALIGPSGAGKSTLLSALNGARPAARGQVLVNGTDLYLGFESLKPLLGYVPQEDIVHRELTVARSLDYTARLRLPADTSAAERAKRVSEVLGLLELSERRDTEVGRLSGGQRKRVSIAAELLTEPSLLFLDEPTSGLDPGLEEALMLLLRELSYKGKTVALVTHTLDNIHLCDAVVLLVDGRLAFLGPAAEARAYFGIGHMVALYTRLKEKPAEEWQAEFRASETYTKRVEQPLATAGPTEARRESRPTADLPAHPAVGRVRQLGIFARRYLETLTRDARNAGLLVLQAPLIAGLIGLSMLYGPSDIAFAKPKNTLLFLLALAAVWFGCSNAARELVKERAIYLRERMVALRVGPYVTSKLVVLAGLAAIQCALFLLILHLWFGIPGSPPLLFASMLLASVVGILMGLALSALASSADRAMTLLPILLIPQVLFTIPSVQMDMKGPAGLIARAMPTWWGYDLLRRVALAPGEAMAHEATEERLKAAEPTLMTKKRFEEMLGEGYLMFNYRSAIEVTWTAAFPERLAQALRVRPAIVDAAALLAMAAGLLALTVRLQTGVRS